MDQPSVFINCASPVMHKEKFANEVGVTVDTVNGWLDRGYVPSLCIGRHRLINIAQLTRECLESEPK